MSVTPFSGTGIALGKDVVLTPRPHLAPFKGFSPLMGGASPVVTSPSGPGKTKPRKGKRTPKSKTALNLDENCTGAPTTASALPSHVTDTVPPSDNESDINKDIFSIAHSIANRHNISDSEVEMSESVPSGRKSMSTDGLRSPVLPLMTGTAVVAPEGDGSAESGSESGSGESGSESGSAESGSESGSGESGSESGSAESGSESGSESEEGSTSPAHFPSTPSPGESSDEETQVTPGGVQRSGTDSQRDAPDTSSITQLRYQTPKDFEKQGTYGGRGTLWLENARRKKRELWLVQVPLDFNMKDISGQKAPLSGSISLAASKTGPRFSVHSIASDEMDDVRVLLPSKEDSSLKLGPAFKGQMKIVPEVKVPPVVFPPTKKIIGKAPIPEGLKMRNTPFGQDGPVRFSSVRYTDVLDRGDLEKKDKKKRKKQNKEQETGPVEVQENEGDVTHEHKKKKKKKRSKEQEEVTHPVEVHENGIEEAQEPKKKKKKKRKHEEEEAPSIQIENEETVASQAEDSENSSKKKKKRKKDKHKNM